MSAAANIEELAKKRVWILDANGVLYPRDGAFSRKLYGRIADNFKEILRDDRKLALSFFCQALASPLTAAFKMVRFYPAHRPENISKALYILAVKTIVKKAKPEQAAILLDKLYGKDHSEIKPDLDLVTAFKIARAKGIKIFFNTNGLSGKNPSENLHIQHAMAALGFDQETIEYMRNQTFDVVDAVNAGCSKSAPLHFKNHFLPQRKIDPRKALIIEDSIRNLCSAAKAGLTVVWAHTTDEQPKQQDVLAAEEIGAFLTRHVGSTLLDIARLAPST